MLIMGMDIGHSGKWWNLGLLLYPSLQAIQDLEKTGIDVHMIAYTPVCVCVIDERTRWGGVRVYPLPVRVCM